MQIEQISASRFRYIIGPRTVLIDRGGEDIANNTYGFEIEFCSHDSSVFSFTHVDALQCGFSSPALRLDQQEALFTGKGDALSGLPLPNSPAWKIESDSGNVLEMVTPPLRFPSINQAQDFRTALAGVLFSTITPQQPQMDGGLPINAILLGEWLDKVREPLQDLVGKVLSPPGFVQFYVRVASWQAVGGQLNEENVDDGINIPAARMRHARNRDSWEPYVLSTVLSRSEKDWGAGYSSQLNMPMSLMGYFLYSRRKYEHAVNRFKGIESWLKDRDGPLQITQSTDTVLRKNVTTWFWRSILWSVLEAYMVRLSPRHYANGVWTPENVARWGTESVTRLAFLYVMTSKILTGAMGALSEPDQLKMQQYAWFRNSTAVMATDGPVEEQALLAAMSQYLNAPITLDRNWLEYHSAMKDLTGLWFKASLFDVLLCEEMDILFIDRVGTMLQQPNDIWSTIIHRHLRLIKSDRWNRRMERLRPGYADDLEDLDETSLVNMIQRIEVELGRALSDVDNWERWTMDADPATRKFLHYADAPAWEGRYDTMYKPIPPAAQPPGNPWSYLVEHRFN